MGTKVTIQDIADELGVSRNTVSKAINNTGVLADATRKKVLEKATEMGYKQFSYIMDAGAGNPMLSVPMPKEKKEVALFIVNFIGSSHFASPMMDKFQKELSSLGYSLMMYRILSDELGALKLPASFSKSNTAGIICVEMFDYEYSAMLCGLGLPVLFVDAPAPGFQKPLEADILCMENQSGIYLFIKEMVKRGKASIGFIGKYNHCQSFYERYTAFRNAMHFAGLPCLEEYCITGANDNAQIPDSEHYKIYLAECLQKLERMPDVFICANDFIAIDAMQALKKSGYRIPQDLYLCGFDDSPESRIVTPALTTIHIHSQIMGVSAVNLLLSRIAQPDLNYRTVHTETTLIYRESTGD